MESWAVYALASAVFAALTSILAKLGLGGVNADLATALRTVVVLIFAWGMVFLTGAQREIHALTGNNLIFLALSGAATGLSWLCYYRAIQLGNVTQVAPIDKLSIVLVFLLSAIILKEPLTFKRILSCVLIAAGVLVTLF